MRHPLALLLLAAPLAADDKPLALLAGSYTVKELHREGKAAPDDVKRGYSGVKIAGDKLTVTMGGKEIVAVLKNLDAAKTPAEIDLFPQTESYNKDRPFKGIYEKKGDALTLTFVEDGDRPKDFGTDAKTATKLVLEKK